MLKKIVHAQIISPDEIRPDHTIEIENGKIAAIHPTVPLDLQASIDDFVDAAGLIVTPGLIDLHIHGCLGVDSMDANRHALEVMSGHLVEHGVTSFYATTVTQTPERITAALENILRCKDDLPGANLLGAHVEGPYISRDFMGAQNPAFLREPQAQEYQAWLESGVVKLITIAPELEGMERLIEMCAQYGVEVAIGHSQADYDQVRRAADQGARQATHLFNGMRGLHHREPGTVGGILLDRRIFAQIIADGIHLHPAIVKLVVQVKGIDRTILITDAIRAAGLADAAYELGGQTVIVKDGAARIANGSLAGSTLMLDQAVRNTILFTGLDFQTVIAMATKTPAQAMNIAHSKGNIAVDYDADLAFFNDRNQVVAAMLGGSIKYNNRKDIGV